MRVIPRKVAVSDILSEPTYWRERMYDEKVLVFKGLIDLSQDQLWDIHQVFGNPWTSIDYLDSHESSSTNTFGKDVTTYSAAGSIGRIGYKDLPWHRDIPWQREKRYPIRSLYPRVMTGGVEKISTDFCDCDVLWERLPVGEATELLNTELRLQYWYDAAVGMKDTKTLLVPLCELHHHTNRMSVLLNSFGPLTDDLEFSTHLTGAWVIGTRVNGVDKGVRNLDRLHKLVSTEDNIYKHFWEMGDLVLFDNYSGVFHRRAGIENQSAKREFWRMSIKHYWQT